MSLAINERRLVFIFLCLGCVTISFNVAAIAAVIPTISLDLGLSDLLVSKIIPFYMIPYGLGALLYAPLAKRVSFRNMITVAMLIFAVSSFSCAVTRSLGFLLLSRLVMGLSGASIIPLGLILIGKMFEKEVRGRLVGLFFSSSFIASLAGIFLSGLADWRWLFYIPAILGVITAVLVFALTKESLNKRETFRINYLKVFVDKTLREVFIFIFVISLLYHGVNSWLGVYLSRLYHLNQLTISLLFVVIAIGGILGQNIGGHLADKKGRIKACYLGIILLSFSTMLLAGIFPLVLLGVVLIIFSAGWTIGHNGMSTVLTDFPDEFRPEIASLNSALRFLSGGIGFSLSGLFVDKSFQLTFFVIGLLMLGLSFLVKKIIPETLTA